jgi:hypothetical protein
MLDLRERHWASIYQTGYMMDLHPSRVRSHLHAATRTSVPGLVVCATP